jgi:hypothetical protein
MVLSWVLIVSSKPGFNRCGQARNRATSRHRAFA